MKNVHLITSVFLLSASMTVNAGIIAPLNDGSWSILAQEDQTEYYLSPGYGGQLFDAEYLLYKFDEPTGNLSIALQTGFNILGDNHITYQNQSYWGGDLFLSFDGSTSDYEFALDFGQITGGWSDSNLSQASGSISAVSAGLYGVTGVSNDVYSGHTASNPLAMTSGNLLESLTFNDYQGIHQTNGTNYYSYAYSTTFNLSSLGLSYDITQLDAHWTMSCGNDAINGHGEIPPVSVPEPASWMLMSTGLLALFGGLIARRRREVL